MKQAITISSSKDVCSITITGNEGELTALVLQDIMNQLSLAFEKLSQSEIHAEDANESQG